MLKISRKPTDLNFEVLESFNAKDFKALIVLDFF